MVMWLIMRGALDDKVKEVYRFYTVPASTPRSDTSFWRTPSVQQKADGQPAKDRAPKAKRAAQKPSR
jgi:hypothetical protein